MTSPWDKGFDLGGRELAYLPSIASVLIAHDYTEDEARLYVLGFHFARGNIPTAFADLAKRLLSNSRRMIDPHVAAVMAAPDDEDALRVLRSVSLERLAELDYTTRAVRRLSRRDWTKRS